MIKRLALTAVIASLLTACTGFFDKDNTPTPTPLTPLNAEIKTHQLWSSKIGNGSGDDYLKLSPTLNGDAIYTSSSNGVITATNKQNGNAFWSVNTKTAITSGPGVGNGIVVVGGLQGDVIALQQIDGRLLWKKTVSGEILAKPAISNNMVVIKTIDGTIHALSARDGNALWSYQQTEPSLILRGSSAPLLRDNLIFVGFANGSLAKIGLRNGQVDWTHPIALPEGGFSIERMIDIDADPVIYGHRIFAATYQGKVASLDWQSGKTLWEHDISSYTGMTADDNTAYISDAKGYIWAFGANSGLVNWRQTQLEARNVSGPAVMGSYVVVGDSEGYLHWLSKRDGHIAAREFAGNTILATPIVENNVLYAQTTNGSLVAYTLSS